MISKEDYEICQKRFKEMWKWIAGIASPKMGKEDWFRNLEKMGMIDKHDNQAYYHSRCYACYISSILMDERRGRLKGLRCCDFCPIRKFHQTDVPFVAGRPPCLCSGSQYLIFSERSDYIKREAAKEISELEWYDYEEIMKYDESKDG